MAPAQEIKGRNEDDPIALRSAFLLRQFERYLAWFVGRSFHALRVAKDAKPSLSVDRQAIIFCNHPSWWDPLTVILTSRFCFPDRPGFAPMDKKALRSYRFFKRLGVFGVDLETRAGARRFLENGRRILAHPGALLWVTAEGRFRDPRDRPVRLQPGIAHLAKRHPDVLLQPMAIEYPFWNERYPEALLRFGTPIDAADLVGCSSASMVDQLENALAATMDRLADDSSSRDPERFDTLLDGNVGIGGVYDLWRRSTARWRGERFTPAHDADRR